MPGMTRFPVVRIVDFCTRYPWPVLVSAAVIAAAAGFYAVDHFAITTNVSNLLSSRLPSHERETQYEKVFSDRTIVAVVTAPTPELVDPVGGPPHGASCHVARSNPRCLAG